MVYYHIDNPSELPPAQLDMYLEAGWYRMQQHVFTTDLISKDNRFIPVFWLRHVVANYQPSTTHKKIIAANKRFTVGVAPLVITDELEELYQQYRNSVDFDISTTIQESLLGEADTSIFQSLCITVRDGTKLIAAGVLDDGHNSIAGILNFYNPAYATKSLGKFLMLQKMKYAQQQGKQFYYTGYMSTAFSKFDYKLMLGTATTEVYKRQAEAWVPWNKVTTFLLESWLVE